MGNRIKRVELSRNSFEPLMPATPLDYARRYQTDRTENDLDSAIVRSVQKDHSPANRPEVKGAADTFGWNRYGGPDGDGPDRLVIGRAADSKNRRER
jgi:hypothetical protein